MTDQAMAREHVIEFSFAERTAVAGCGCRAIRETKGDREVIAVTPCQDAALREELARVTQEKEAALQLHLSILNEFNRLTITYGEQKHVIRDLQAKIAELEGRT